MKYVKSSFLNKAILVFFQVCCCVGFAQVESNASIDSFSETIELGGCPQVTAFTLLGTTDTTASFSWNQPTGDIEAYSVDIFDFGADPETATEITFGYFTGSSGTVESLMPNTTYDAYILTICNPTGEVSEYVGPIPFTTTVLGVEDVATKELTIYPNPTSDKLHIAHNELMDWIKIYNTQGQLVMLQLKTLTIDVSALKEGVYFAEMSTSGVMFASKFVKK